MGEVVNERQLGSDSNSSFQLELIEDEQLDRFWPGIERMLDNVPHTWENWTKERFYADAANGRMNVWGVGPSQRIVLVLFTIIAEYPAQRILQVIWAGGHFDFGMVPILDATLNRYADVQECSKIDIVGRPGWERIFGKIGFKREAIILSRPVVRMRVN